MMIKVLKNCFLCCNVAIVMSIFKHPSRNVRVFVVYGLLVGVNTEAIACLRGTLGYRHTTMIAQREKSACASVSSLLSSSQM